jgi:hypothetical protein
MAAAPDPEIYELLFAVRTDLEAVTRDRPGCAVSSIKA